MKNANQILFFIGSLFLLIREPINSFSLFYFFFIFKIFIVNDSYCILLLKKGIHRQEIGGLLKVESPPVSSMYSHGMENSISCKYFGYFLTLCWLMIKRYITEFMGYHYDVFEYVTKARLHAYPLCWRVFYVHLVLGLVGLFTMQNL